MIFFNSIRKMRKQIILVFIAFILFIFLISAVSAEIILSQPKALYNLGEDIEISATVKPTRETSDFLKLTLSCGGEKKDFYFSFLKLNANQEKSIQESFSLTKTLLGDMKGDCMIIAGYAENSAESQAFTISDKINVKAETNKLDYLPGEEIIVKGEAIKENSLALNGFAETSLLTEELSASGVVSEGKFEIKLVLPEDISAGGYSINVRAYEKDSSGEESNKGETTSAINIKKVPKKVDVALNQQEIKPGNTLEFKILLYDQSENIIEGEASFRIEDSEENLVLEKLTQINKDEAFYLEKNLTFGYYKIKAHSSGLDGERQFYVEENKEAEFRITNSSLIVKNIGNVEYDKSVEIKIGGETRVIDFELGEAEQREYAISAPDGNYDLVVTDGTTEVVQKGVALSGNAISIDARGGSIFTRNKYFLWGFLIFIMAFFIFVASRRILNRRFVASAPNMEKSRGGLIKIERKEKEHESSADRISSLGSGTFYGKIEAEHSLVLHGQKQDVAIICVKIKNPIGKESEKNLEQAFSKAYEIRAARYRTGDYICLIFSPIVTRTFNNYNTAARAALGISKSLDDYNRKFREKIEYGMSVHSGTVANSFQNNILKFTSFGNTLSKAKKIADISNGEVLLSKEIHEKTVADVKVEKQIKEGIEVFTATRVSDSEKNRKFIHDFLERLEEEKKKK